MEKKGDVLDMKGNGLKIAGIILTLAGAGLGLANSFVGNKRQEELIKDEAAKAATEAVNNILKNK